MREQLAALGIRYERYPAVDGQSPEVAAEWMAYKRQGPQRRTDPRNVTDWRDFYVGDKPHSARVAFYEEQRGRPAIATAGAWGLYRSMRRVIEKALAAKVERLLILEDDVLFHRDTEMLWKKVTAELPKDWQILQLGAMQLHWEDNWIKWHAQHLYRCQGSSLAAHAVALKADAMRAVLARVEAPALPFDVGPLTEVKRLYKDRCFTVYPNIVIQDGRDSEIGMSKIFATEVAKKTNVYRWAYEEYGPAALAAAAAEAAAARKAKRIKRPQAVLSQPETDPLPLQPYGTALDDVDRIVVLLSADDTERVSGYIAMLQAQKEQETIAPIVVIDDLDLVLPLRHAGLVFEYVPPRATYDRALPADRDSDLVIARRLSILRRKWRPLRIMAFGASAQARLQAWRASPFEQATLGPDLLADVAPQADGSA